MSDLPNAGEIPHSRPLIDNPDEELTLKTLRSGMVASGNRAREFEHAVGQYLGLEHAMATSTGTAALVASLELLEVGKDSEVVIPTYACSSIREAVERVGARPVLCDVGRDWCLSRETVEPRISRRTRAIVVVHTFGIAAPVPDLLSWGIPVIEDLAQAFGGSRDGVPLGSLGTIAICSFNATKAMCTGEGGMVLTSSPDLAERLHQRRLRHPATNYRMPDLLAALGLSQLARYNQFLKRRRELADFYFSNLAGLPVELPYDVRSRSMFFRFPLRIDADYRRVHAAFEAQGVHVRRGVDSLMHSDDGSDNAFPGADDCYQHTLSIPIYPSLTDAQAERVVTACRRVLGGRGGP